MHRPRVLAEDWLPVEELSIESLRERRAVHALPPLSFLHVWWARRPLVASAGVVLGGLLPAWTQELADAFPDIGQLATEHAYREWFKRLVGIWGNPVKAQRAADTAKASGVPLPHNPFTYKQAYRNGIPLGDIELLHRVLTHHWGEVPAVGDPTAGGGAIPFTSARLGLPTYANDLNGVAASVLAVGVKLAAERGPALGKSVREWGTVLTERITKQLTPYFPSSDKEAVANYIWVNAIPCPRTGRLIPLLPDKWLRKTPGKEAALELVTDADDGTALQEPCFRVVHGSAVSAADADQGYVVRGSALSPYTGLVVDGDHVKAEAQAGRMRPLLCAVSTRGAADGKRSFRTANQADLDALSAAAQRLIEVRTDWERDGYLPTEEIAPGNYDRGHRMYGLNMWADLFTDRQLLVHGTFAAEFSRLSTELRETEPALAEPVLQVLAMMQGKALNYNSRLCSWHTPKQTMRSVFEKHNFSFKWSFAEFEGARELFPWCLDQAVHTYEGIARLFASTGQSVGEDAPLARAVTVTQGSAGALTWADGSLAHVCMDPPYYDNVMYAELSDFFYVWEKHTIGLALPTFFAGDLADKDNEAVANLARFAQMGRRTRQLADADYEAKMTAIFSECRRVLRDDGVLTVMFTHKRAEAWDTLGMSLLRTGFTIEASWPVNTEAEHSLHQSGVNSAASTIMLVCRKRSIDTTSTQDVYLEDIEGQVRQVAREAVQRFRADGIDGVDLLLSAYGPTLGVVSQYWPVHSSEAGDDGRARLLRPEEALSIARSEIVRVQRARLVGYPIEFDPLTDFVVAFWDVVRDDTATFDEARRLALAVGALDIDELQRANLLEKKTGTVRLLSPKERRRARTGDEELPGVRPQAASFANLIDAVHTVCLVADEDGLAHAKALMDRTGLSKDNRFAATVQALVNAVPRVQVKGTFLLPLAGSLDRVVTAYMPQIVVPPEPVEDEALVQGDLFADPVA